LQQIVLYFQHLLRPGSDSDPNFEEIKILILLVLKKPGAPEPRDWPFIEEINFLPPFIKESVFSLG
jgi:hypothetical protein